MTLTAEPPDHRRPGGRGDSAAAGVWPPARGDRARGTEATILSVGGVALATTGLPVA